MTYTTVFDSIRIEFPFQVQHLLNLEIRQSLNEHAVAVIKCLVEDAVCSTSLYEIDESTIIKIKKNIDGKEITLFSGIPMEINVADSHKGIEVELTLYSLSILLDFKDRKRSFQNINHSLGKLFKKVAAEYGGDIIVSDTADLLQKNPIIQYEETDWEFIKRIASWMGAVVYPFAQGEKPQIYIGIPERVQEKETISLHKIKKDLKKYYESRTSHKEIREMDQICYHLESDTYYELGCKLPYQNMDFVVAESRCFLEHGIFKQEYQLKQERGIQTFRYTNPKIIGASMEGRVLSVKKDKVKLHLLIDKEQAESEAYWFSCGTPYTGEGNTGWYAMPEIGSNVMLYLPGGEEKDAYIRGVLRQDGIQNEKTQHPGQNYFGTAEGKEMRMSPEEISFQDTANHFFLTLGDKSGVEIKSSEDILIYSEDAILGESEMVTMDAKDRIILSTTKTSIVIDDIVQVRS